MKKRNFLLILLSVIMATALAIPAFAVFADTSDSSTANQKTITVEIFNGNADDVSLVNATQAEENGITVIAAQSKAWNGNQIKFKDNYRDLTVAKSGQLCFEYKSTGSKSWANVCAVAVQDGWAQTFSVCGDGELLGISSEYVIKKYDLSALTEAQLTKFYGFALVFSADNTSFNIKRVWVEYPNPDYVEDTSVNITFYDGNKTKIEDLSTAYSTVNGVLPEYEVDGKVFVGWQTAGGELYAAGAAVTAETPIEFYATAIKFITNGGAYFRIGETAGVSGIRFDTTFNSSDYEVVKNFVSEFGTLILPTETLNAKEITLYNFTVDKDILKVKCTSDVANNTYYGAIFSLKEANYNRDFSARGYITVKYSDNTTETYYSGVVAHNSVAYMADYYKQNKSDEYNKLTDAQKKIVDAYAVAYTQA